MGAPESFQIQWDAYRQRVESALAQHLVSRGPAGRLCEAMAYACLNGGKRFRAVLAYACGELAGAELDDLDAAACALEMVHAYSLVHDDLPAMDDDELRRGKATCHIAYDEATAILVGDALQSKAFEILGSKVLNPVPSRNRIQMVEVLSRAIGVEGMAGGQALDMSATAKAVTLAELEDIHRLKTGALIQGAAEIGVLGATEFDAKQLTELSRYAADLGHAFQIYDDVLDAVSDAQTLGKNAGADARMEKSTYVSLLGLDKAREEAERLSSRAIETVSGLGDNTGFLKSLARFVVTRSY